MKTETIVASTPRAVVQTLRGQPASDGAGVKLTRVIGQPRLPDLDPFLLLDEFGTDKAEDYIAGFPEHPHRGFETVTYMLDGRMRHKDNHGNEGVLEPGAVQRLPEFVAGSREVVSGRSRIKSRIDAAEQNLQVVIDQIIDGPVYGIVQILFGWFPDSHVSASAQGKPGGRRVNSFEFETKEFKFGDRPALLRALCGSNELNRKVHKVFRKGRKENYD